MTFDALNWCDVETDDDAPIPELPPLPLIMSHSLPTTCATVPESPKSDANTRSSASEHSSSAAGSGNDIENQDPITPDGNDLEEIEGMKTTRFRNLDDESPKKTHKSPPFVCFIGNFPANCSMSDLRDFVISKQVAFTEIRMGPKKKHKSNGSGHVSMGFGYVDLATREDYERFLMEDGCMHKNRKIRIDHATQKKTAKKDKKSNTNRGLQARKNNISSRKNKNMNKHQLSRKMLPRISRANSAPGKPWRRQSPPKAMQSHGNAQLAKEPPPFEAVMDRQIMDDSPKSQMRGRAARFFRTRKTGARNYQKKAQRRHGGRFDPFGGARPREDVLKSRRGIGSM